MGSLGFRRSLFLLVALLLVAAPWYAAAAAAASCAATTFSNRVFATCSDLPHLAASLHWTYDRAAAALSVAFVAPPRRRRGVADRVQGHGSRGGVRGRGDEGFREADPREGGGGGEHVWQVGSAVSGGSPEKHAFGADNLAAKGKLDLVKGVASASGSGGSVSRERNVHGVLNAVSWGILLPIGAIIARYLKTFKSADPAWFYLHVSCQVIGYGLGVGGWGTGLNLGSKSKGVTYTTHRNIGIALFSLATLQLFALLLRPNKDHKYRFYWNIYHHVVGYAVIILGIINIFKGLKILDPAQKWTTAYIVAICILGAIAFILEIVTWIIVLRRKSSDEKPYIGSTNGQRSVQQPLAV
uniref:Cytochrome b561 domain-containing protein n=1 Tax=Ananas comosus var. bracteatus TaxID=296719 RepID=A0A6V7Q8G5_ANACO|nr:unnamed protein product [Ananas comosus var. bracteatus]